LSFLAWMPSFHRIGMISWFHFLCSSSPLHLQMQFKALPWTLLQSCRSAWIIFISPWMGPSATLMNLRPRAHQANWQPQRNRHSRELLSV
jgi:hypothetical protein